jgi:hypothetical protein
LFTGGDEGDEKVKSGGEGVCELVHRGGVKKLMDVHKPLKKKHLEYFLA